MNEIEKNDMVAVFTTLATIELAFAELYEACAKVWEADAKFWMVIAREERGHVEYINKMSQIIAQSPDQFILEKPFKPIALQTAGQTAKTVAQKVNNGQITQQEIFNIAIDIEKSIIEAKYNDILKTENKLYRDLADKLVSESYEHRNMIQLKSDEVNKVRRILKD
jgi:hypothetical protein